MTLSTILAGEPEVDLHSLSPIEKSQILERIVSIIKPFFSMNPRTAFISEGFRTLEDALAQPSRLTNHKKSYSQSIDLDLDSSTLCLELDKTPDRQEVYRMPTRTRYNETTLMITIDGRFVMWRSDVECEHDQIVDATFYHVLLDEIDLAEGAQGFYELEPSPTVHQAMHTLRRFHERCLKQVEPVYAADAQLKQLLTRLGFGS